MRSRMTKNLRILIMAAIVLTAVNSPTGVTRGAATHEGQIVGGYGERSNNDAEVVAAARFAIKKERQTLHSRILLISINRAEMQVVAGLNYRLCMTVKVSGRTRNVTVVVYKTLKQKLSLTSWTANG